MLNSLKWLIPYRCFGPTYRSHLKRSTSPRGIYIAADVWSHAQDTTALQHNILSTSDGVTSSCAETPNDNTLFRFEVDALTSYTASTTLHWRVQLKSHQKTRIISFKRPLLLKEAACFLWGTKYVIKYYVNWFLAYKDALGHESLKTTRPSVGTYGWSHAVKAKGKVRPRRRHEVQEGEQSYSSTLPLTSVLDGVVNATPRPLYPRERDPVLIVQEAVWAAGPVWTVRKISPTPGFDLRTVQPVASRLPTVRSRLRLVRYISSKGPMCPGTWVGCFRYLHMQQSALLLYVRPKNWSKRRVSALVLYVLIPRNLIARDLVVCSTPCRLLWWTSVEQFYVLLRIRESFDRKWQEWGGSYIQILALLCWSFRLAKEN